MKSLLVWSTHNLRFNISVIGLCVMAELDWCCSGPYIDLDHCHLTDIHSQLFLLNVLIPTANNNNNPQHSCTFPTSQ